MSDIVKTSCIEIAIIARDSLFPQGSVILTLKDRKSFLTLKKAYQEHRLVGLISKQSYGEKLLKGSSAVLVMCAINELNEVNKSIKLTGVSRSEFISFEKRDFGKHIICGEIKSIFEQEIYRDKTQKGSDFFLLFNLLFETINTFRLFGVDLFSNKVIRKMHLNSLTDYLAAQIDLNNTRSQKILETIDPVKRCQVFFHFYRIIT